MAKLFLLVLMAGLAFAQDESDITLRAPSTFQNCECQCDSYQWTNSAGQLVGNCRSSDASGFFCYVSGRAANACRDVKLSRTRTDSFGNVPKFYSYEACTTPPRNSCYQQSPFGQNFGDGDRPVGIFPGGPGVIGGGLPVGGHPVGPGGFGGVRPPIGPGGATLGSILGIRSGANAGEAEAAPAADGSAVTFTEA